MFTPGDHEAYTERVVSGICGTVGTMTLYVILTGMIGTYFSPANKPVII